LLLSGGPDAARADIVVGRGFNISNTPDNSSNPVTVGDDAGDLIIAWGDGRDGNDIYVSRSNDFGVTYTPPVKMNNAPAALGTYAPFTSQTGGGVAWITLPPSGNTGTLNFTTLQGTGVGQPFQIDAGVLISPSPIVAGDQFHMATWFAIPGQQASQMDVYSASSSDGGQQFQQPRPVDFGLVQYGTAQDLQGTFFAATLHEDGTIDVLRMDAQGNWQLDRTIQAGARSMAIEQTEDGVMIHWETKVPPVSVLAEYRKNGVWTDPVTLTGLQTASGSDFAYSGLNQMFTWTQINPDTSNSQVAGRVSTDNGLNFGPILPISPPDQGATHARTFLIGDEASVLYQQLAGSSTQDVISNFLLGGLSSPPVPKPTGLNPWAGGINFGLEFRYAQAEAAPIQPPKHLLLAWSDTAPGRLLDGDLRGARGPVRGREL
jgi:hypothetical protein